MPHNPEVNRSVANISESLFSEMADRLSVYPGEIYPLYVGDTWLQPPEGCRLEDLPVSKYPELYRYPPSHGIAELLSIIAQRMTLRTGLSTSPEEVLVAAGATGAIASVIGTILSPGEEILVLSPYWPLITGAIKSFDGIPVIVPFGERRESPEPPLDALEQRYTQRTVALYLNSPNNPTGQVIPRAWLEAIVQWASSKGLWIISDEVYEDYVYTGFHTYCRPLAPERTFAVYSFSKAYGMAGNRCGYVIGPAEAMKHVRKVNTHTSYGAPMAAQIAGCKLLTGLGDKWIEEARAQYRAIGEYTADRLGVKKPDGSQYLFLDLTDSLDETGLQGFLDSCIARGLLLTPGTFFGAYPRHVRLCFTSVAPEVVRRGVEVLAAILGL